MGSQWGTNVPEELRPAFGTRAAAISTKAHTAMLNMRETERALLHVYPRGAMKERGARAQYQGRTRSRSTDDREEVTTVRAVKTIVTAQSGSWTLTNEPLRDQC